MDLLCTETVENSSELPTTDVLRDRTDLLHHEPANAEPVDDDIEMMKKPQEESDTKPEEEIVNKTVRLDSQDNEDPQPNKPNRIRCLGCFEKGHILELCPKNANEKLKLTSCQLYQMGQTNDSVEKAKPRVDRSTDCLQNPTQKRAPGTLTTPLPLPAPPKQPPGNPNSTRPTKPEVDLPSPGTVAPLIAKSVKRTPSPKPKQNPTATQQRDQCKSAHWQIK